MGSKLFFHDNRLSELFGFLIFDLDGGFRLQIPFLIIFHFICDILKKNRFSQCDLSFQRERLDQVDTQFLIQDFVQNFKDLY